MSVIRESITAFLDVRRDTISTLKDIKNEVDDVGKTAAAFSILGGGLAIAGGAVTATTILFPPAAAVLGPVSAGIGIAATATGTATKLVSKFAKGIKEKDLEAKARKVIEKDQELTQRLKNAAGLLRDLVAASKDTVAFLQKAAELGVTTTTEVHTLLNMSETRFAMEALAKVSSILENVNQVTSVIGPVVTIINIPVEFILVIKELISTSGGDLSKVSKKIQDDIHSLKTEYKSIQTTLTFLP